VPRSPYNRHPLPPFLVLWLTCVIVFVLALFLLNAIEYAYRSIGIGEGALFALVIASLAGGFVNIPITRVRSEPVTDTHEFVVWGVPHRVPVVAEPQATILAVNLGGAVIPAGVSVALLLQGGMWWQAAVAVAFVTVVVHRVARPVRGLGIAVPALVPPVAAAIAALLLPGSRTAAVAYVSGTLGALIGADLLNLHRLSAVGARVASIGGAGTFDGIFLAGILAVVLVGAK
jgi:uncharacterized membrane protein